jgi:hypothetical protein
MNSLFNQNQLIYSLDTSSLIAAFHEWYPIENFPALWREIEELIKNNRLKMEETVFEEAMRDEQIKEWCDQRKLKSYLQSVSDESVRELVNEIQSKFPGLVDEQRGKSKADPWVIALAMVTSNCIVVTQESYSPSERKPKIPNVCAHFGVECIEVVDLIKRENWIF